MPYASEAVSRDHILSIAGLRIQNVCTIQTEIYRPPSHLLLWCDPGGDSTSGSISFTLNGIVSL